MIDPDNQIGRFRLRCRVRYVGMISGASLLLAADGRSSCLIGGRDRRMFLAALLMITPLGVWP